MKKRFSFVIAATALVAFALAGAQANARNLEDRPNAQQQTVPCKPDNSNCPEQKRPGKRSLPITSTGPTLPPKTGQSGSVLREDTPAARVHYRTFNDNIHHAK